MHEWINILKSISLKIITFLKQNDTKTLLDNIGTILTWFGVLLGGLIGYNVAFRELKFSRLQKSLDEDYKLKKEAYELIIEIMSKYIHELSDLIKEPDFVNSEYIDKVICDLKKLYGKTQNCTL